MTLLIINVRDQFGTTVANTLPLLNPSNYQTADVLKVTTNHFQVK
jgi:hypothetical protein